MIDLSKVFSLVSALRVAEAWSLTLLIKVRINYWNKLLFGRTTGVGAGLGTRRLRAGFPRQTRDIVKNKKQRAESGERRVTLLDFQMR